MDMTWRPQGLLSHSACCVQHLSLIRKGRKGDWTPSGPAGRGPGRAWMPEERPPASFLAGAFPVHEGAGRRLACTWPELSPTGGAGSRPPRRAGPGNRMISQSPSQGLLTEKEHKWFHLTFYWILGLILNYVTNFESCQGRNDNPLPSHQEAFGFLSNRNTECQHGRGREVPSADAGKRCPLARAQAAHHHARVSHFLSVLSRPYRLT